MTRILRLRRGVPVMRSTPVELKVAVLVTRACPVNKASVGILFSLLCAGLSLSAFLFLEGLLVRSLFFLASLFLFFGKLLLSVKAGQVRHLKKHGIEDTGEMDITEREFLHLSMQRLVFF